jgi:hypothetical protein
MVQLYEIVTLKSVNVNQIKDSVLTFTCAAPIPGEKFRKKFTKS